MADDYEADAMPPRGEVRYRDKLVSRSLAGVLGAMGVASGALGVGVLAGIDPAAPAWVAIFPFGVAIACTFLGLTRSVMRLALTDQELVIDQGLLATRIPLAAIDSIEMVDVSERRAAGGWELLAPSGKGALFVGVTWRDGSKVRKSLLNGTDVHALAEHLKAGVARLGVRVRVEAEPAAEGVELADEDREREREG